MSDSVNNVEAVENNRETLLQTIYTHIWETTYKLYTNTAEIQASKKANQYNIGTYYILTDAVSLYCSMQLRDAIPLGTDTPAGIVKFLQSVPQSKYKLIDKKLFCKEVKKQYKASVKLNKLVYGEERNGLDHYVSQFNRREFLWKPTEVQQTVYSFNLARIYTMLQIMKNITEVGLVYADSVPVLCIKDNVNYEIYYLLPAKVGGV